MNKLARKLVIMEGFWSFGSGLFLPIFAIFTQQVGGDILDAGIAFAIFLFVTSSFEYPIGKLLDKHKEKWFIATDYFLEGLIFIGYAFIENTYQLFLLQIGLGIANAIGDPAWESLYSKSTPEKKSGRFWAYSHLLTGYLTAAGIIIGAFFINKYGFDVVFIGGGIFSFIAGFMAIRSLKQSN